MLLRLDFASEVPIYQQIRNQIVLGIAGGQLVPGEKLPTIRALADEAGINMMTVNKAYALLKQEGFITADRRSGATVAALHGQMDAHAMEKLRSQLSLAISEARLRGVPLETLLDECRRLYEKEEKK